MIRYASAFIPPTISGIAAITAGDLAVDIAATDVWTATNNATLNSITISNMTPGAVNVWTLRLISDGNPHTQPVFDPSGSYRFPNDVPPAFSTGLGQIDTITFVSYDGDGIWLGYANLGYPAS